MRYFPGISPNISRIKLIRRTRQDRQRGGRTYTYDSVPNLKCVNRATPATSIQYTYDGDQKRTRVNQGNVKTHEFHSVHGNLLAEYTPGSPGKLIQYIYLNGKRIAQKESAQ